MSTLPLEPTPPPPAPRYWSLKETNAERLHAIAAFGFTERQSRFLLEVLLHAGVFLERQYCQFAGIAHGQKSTNFIHPTRRSPLRDADHTGQAASRTHVPCPLQTTVDSHP